MPSTQIGDSGIYLLKIRKYGENRAVSIPKKVAEGAELTEGFFVGILAVGPCVVMVQIRQGANKEIEEEVRVAFEAAIAAWRKSHGEVLVHTDSL
jgi:hypothetical protein